MPCYKPIAAYRSREGRDPKTGKWKLSFNIREGYHDLRINVPCGRCVGCRLEKSRQWAIRCMHEQSMYKDNCFITLTYNDDNLPKNGSLNKTDFQKFMKRLRKKYGDGIKYYHCGEYGEQLQRPHHHACIFNHDFDDKVLFKNRKGVRLYTSESLSKLWKFGYSTVGDVTFQSAAYVARYIMKKVTGNPSLEHYSVIDKETGEILQERIPEFTTMSRRPGIGKAWFDKYSKDVYPHDQVILGEKLKMKPPRYYDNLYDIQNPEEMRTIKIRRQKKQNPEEHTDERLRVKETIKLRKAKKLVRGFEAA